MFQSACWQVVPGRNTIFSVWAPCNLKDCFYIGGRNPRLWEVHRVTPNKSWAKGEYPWFQQWVAAALCYYPIWAADFFNPLQLLIIFHQFLLKTTLVPKLSFSLNETCTKNILAFFVQKGSHIFSCCFKYETKKCEIELNSKVCLLKNETTGCWYCWKKSFNFACWIQGCWYCWSSWWPEKWCEDGHGWLGLPRWVDLLASKWKIPKDVKTKNQKLTYISPGGLS